MRIFFRLLGPALIVLAAASAKAEEPPQYEVLMEALATSKTATEARRLVPQIWSHWLTAPDDAAQAVLNAAIQRRQIADYLGALKHLDILVKDYPDYAEGWNQRATIYFLIGDWDASLADVDAVLAIEPRHFGALSGRAMIYMQQGRVPLAQLAIKEAKEHHPFLNDRFILNAPGSEDI
ncbi:MAG: hypothetical protein AAF748_06430 [Pseudomonadota bacterium]